MPNYENSNMELEFIDSQKRIPYEKNLNTKGIQDI